MSARRGEVEREGESRSLVAFPNAEAERRTGETTEGTSWRGSPRPLLAWLQGLLDLWSLSVAPC